MQHAVDAEHGPLIVRRRRFRDQRPFRSADKGGVSAVGDKQNQQGNLRRQQGEPQIDQAVDQIAGNQDSASAEPVRQPAGRDRQD